jgi:hypothetical protein
VLEEEAAAEEGSTCWFFSTGPAASTAVHRTSNSSFSEEVSDVVSSSAPSPSAGAAPSSLPLVSLYTMSVRRPTRRGERERVGECDCEVRGLC